MKITKKNWDIWYLKAWDYSMPEQKIIALHCKEMANSRKKWRFKAGTNYEQGTLVELKSFAMLKVYANIDLKCQ